MRAAILTYHSQNINGRDYRSNDHVALREDLALIGALGRPLVAVRAIVDALLGLADPAAVDGAVALSCDDGTLFDWHDRDHPVHGRQRSFANLIADAADRAGRSAPVRTAFVVASPAARREIDAGCYGGIPYSDDDWWVPASASGRVVIENHSWDHAHTCVGTIRQREQRKGTFLGIDNPDDADAQVRAAADFIDARLPARRTTLFAYPYGAASDYLADEYFPRYRDEHRVDAAFTDEPAIVTEATDRWRVPRFVCGLHWRSAGQLAAILHRLAG
jgi:hypothetical protein